MSVTSSASDRREFIKAFIGCTAAASFLSASVFSGCESKRMKPNILLIFSDDQGIGDVNCYGGNIQTPAIDSIAEEGVRFDYFYASGPSCSPSRYGLMTGKYPIRANSPAFLGALMPGHDDDVRLKADDITLAQILKKEGYKTALLGKWHLGHGSIEYGPNNYGFDHFYGFLPGCVDYYQHTYRKEPNWFRNKKQIKEKGYATDLLTKEAIKYIKENKNNPFFLYLAYNAPHYGKAPEGNLLQAPEEFHKSNPNASDREVYSAMVKSMDTGIEKVLQTLEELDLERDTLVIFISDNGGPPDYGASNGNYKGRKGNLWEGGIKVPCLMKWKGRIKPGTTTKQVGTNVDIMPTIAGIIGTQLPVTPVDGIDISDVLLTNKPRRDREIVFVTGNMKQKVYREGDWKYLIDNDEEFLFNLLDDPYEDRNLSQSAPDKVKSMRANLQEILDR